jgi:hypothetical protein
MCSFRLLPIFDIFAVFVLSQITAAFMYGGGVISIAEAGVPAVVAVACLIAYVIDRE